MAIVHDKYRGTTEYDQVRELLIETARNRTVVNYVPAITSIMGLETIGEHMGAEIGKMLGEISEDEHLAGRPLLSAVAINTQNRPGGGFFTLASELGRQVGDQDTFWSQELQAAYEEWNHSKPVKKEYRRSQRWMQYFVNEATDELNRLIHDATGIATDCEIHWKSPLASQDYVEYRDQAFLNQIGTSAPKVPLKDFWPNKGAVWDGLATTSSDDVILVEAKANIPEFASSPCGAVAQSSLDLIHQSLGKVQRFMKVHQNRQNPELWANAFYQYANRLAHLYYLRELNKVPAHLIFLDFYKDPDSGETGVKSADEWKSLILLVESCLGIPRNSPLMKFVHHIDIDVGEIENQSQVIDS